MPQSNKKGGRGGSVAGTSARPQASVEPISESQALRDRLSAISIQDMTANDAFLFISSKVPSIKAFEPSWRITGSQLIHYGPVHFIANLQSELIMLPRTTCIEIFIEIQKRIIADASSSVKDSTPGADPIQALKHGFEGCSAGVQVSCQYNFSPIFTNG